MHIFFICPLQSFALNMIGGTCDWSLVEVDEGAALGRVRNGKGVVNLCKNILFIILAWRVALIIVKMYIKLNRTSIPISEIHWKCLIM